MRPMYTLSIDEELSEDGKYLGVLEIANTAAPAIKMTGIAFNSHIELSFSDPLKYRIAAPVLMPSIIYRRDTNTGEEYDVKVTPDVVEQMFVRFMRDRVGGDVFNVEHDESKRVPSFILETWLVENPKEDKSFTTYGLECPEKTWFAVQQFTDKEAYQKAVDAGQVGFSIHGDGVLKLSEIIKPKIKMKRKFIAQFADAVDTDSGEIIVTTDELTEGATVAVLDDTLTPVESFTGDVVIEDQTVSIADNKITGIASQEVETEMAEDEPMECAEDVTVEASADQPEDNPEETDVEMAVETTAPDTASPADAAQAVDAYTKEEVDAKLQELMDMIAELKANASPVQASVEASVQMSETKTPLQIKMEKVEALKRTFK